MATRPARHDPATARPRPGKRARRTPPGADPDKRGRLVASAARLVHAQGFARTTLADVARDSGVPLGNVFYYFQTKEALGRALVDRLTGSYDAMRTRWEAEPDPRRRLEAFIQMSIDNRASLSRSGCPVGTLCAELHKDGGPLAKHAATLLATLLEWIAAEFRRLGKGREASDLAVHLLAAVQGASLLTHAFHDSTYVAREAERLKDWVRTV